MSLFAIADLHLSLGTDKPMDIFGGWSDYVTKLETNWQNKVRPEDTVVIPGDISWGMNFEQSKKDFEFINKLNGRKIISKGNHDYWWNTKNKMDKFFAENGFDTINILHNNHYSYDGFGICGTRGWISDNGEPADQKVLAREAGRLALSIESAQKAGGLTEEYRSIAALHHAEFLSARDVLGAECIGCDGIHFTEEGHRILAEAIALIIKNKEADECF